jgi:hypothetical protein
VRKNAFKKSGMTPERLRELYTSGSTDVDIGLLLGISDSAVAYFRKKFGIQKKGSALSSLSPDVLRELYQSHSDFEIAEMYHVDRAAVRARRSRDGIEAISKSDRVRKDEENPSLIETNPEPQINPPIGIEVVEPPKVPYKKTEDYKKEDADRARLARQRYREDHPAKTTRTFTCKSCGKPWSTEEKGNFSTCPQCKANAESEKRTKTCPYCKGTFLDTTTHLSQTYCNVECRRRAKLERLGQLPPGGFLADQELTCPICQKSFTPVRGNQVYCADECRLGAYSEEKLESRSKECLDTGQLFFDDSPKNNRKFVSSQSRERLGIKLDPTREPSLSPRLGERRRGHLRSGLGGRIDDIKTLKKATTCWWGRASEVIFSVYRAKAKDLVLEFGNRSPYDFEDPEFGRIEVRGTTERDSPQGRPMWLFVVHGLRQSCDYVLFVGYSRDKNRVEHLWFIPSSDIPEALVRFCPSSSEYRWAQWDVSQKWGLMLADSTLKDLLDLPEPERSPDRYAWMDDPSQFSTEAPGHRGRKGEFMYRLRYPTSKDLNRELGSGAPYDFEDFDGIKVNVKVSKRKRELGHSDKWSFCLGASRLHQCDIYSCLCLDSDEKTIIAEYRIPVSAWGDRRTIHIYVSGGQWDQFRVTPTPE